MNKKNTVAFYLNNLVNQSLAPREAEAIMDFIDTASDELFGADFSHKWGARKKRPRIFEPDTKPEPCNRNLSTLRDALKQKTIPNILAPGVDVSLDCVVELFRLNEKERAIVQFFACVARYPMLKALVAEFLETGRFSCRIHITDIDLIAMMCGLSEANVIRALDEKNVLIHSGILVQDSDGELYLHKMIRRALNARIKNTDKLKISLLGERHLGNKNLDFSHVQSGYDYVKSLIDNAVKNNVRGMNILIYGPTGTGKTEMVKQIATNLGYDLYSMRSSNKTRQDKNVALSYLLHAQRILLSCWTKQRMSFDITNILMRRHLN